MDAQARADAPGEFAAVQRNNPLSISRPVDGPLVVCVHGLTTPSFVYEGLAKRLVERGHRVLAMITMGADIRTAPRAIKIVRFSCPT